MKSWLLLLKTENRVHAGNLGYEDETDSSYRWDSTVPNSDKPKRGDKILIWNGETSIGSSVIEKIVVTENQKKIIRRCPHCNVTNIRERNKKLPKFKCGDKNCRKEFGESRNETIRVKTYKSSHHLNWHSLYGRIDGKSLRSFCDQNKSQHSMRTIKWDKVLEKLTNWEKKTIERSSEITNKWITSEPGGRKERLTKVRLGQQQFRKTLIKKFGKICAFIGDTPLEALEAAHLYSYADVEKHYDCGGILLRRDLHRLFDLGLIAVNSISLKIDLLPEIKKFDQYKNLDQKKLEVKLSQEEINWFKDHWNRYRQF